MTSRRQFLQQSLAVAAPLIVSPAVLGADSPGNRINVAFIGTGNQGMGLLKRFLARDLGNVLAVCDVNEGSFGYKEPEHFYGRIPAKKMVDDAMAKKAKGGRSIRCDAVSDFREVLDRDDIDAVVVVVPDHWHRIITVMALEAGKDVYCEKPLTFSVADGRLMIDAVRKNHRILQTGSHERSNPVSQFVCQAARAGKIGRIKRMVTKVGFNNKISPPPGWKPMPVPSKFDYRSWLGPAPDAPYHQDRCLYRFRFHYDYSGGQITNFGAHCNDMAHWGMGLDTGGPTEIECQNASFLPAGSLFNTATQTRFRCLYPNGVELVCESGSEQVQTRFEGTDGWLQTGYDGTSASDPELIAGCPQKPRGIDDPHSSHLANFIDCVKSRAEPRAPVETGHASAVLCHLANAMIRLFPETGPHRIAKWDAANEVFVNDDAANKMLDREQRDPWS
ncbi:Glucose--fructose oxidoreductase precursor [Stieleria neptunia]|uniref:Glucose--fructose oxidoreductase n=1 Tax=Stieleria neptunia TaxID=2527979 RepID=A0A518I3F7_9BACT|nr:Gfo/Idh/MocA family oxidoreductase [Stieleria neptunia]QDV47635.1 Glucose--fructose oxidoreductase precursor [Stieleria neptunia]